MRSHSSSRNRYSEEAATWATWAPHWSWRSRRRWGPCRRGPRGPGAASRWPVGGRRAAWQSGCARSRRPRWWARGGPPRLHRLKGKLWHCEIVTGANFSWHNSNFVVFQKDVHTGWSIWILQQKVKYSSNMLFRYFIVKLERDLSNSIHITSIYGVKSSWATL